MITRILPGRSAPLGATPGPNGTNFAVATTGDRVTLCLFDPDGTRIELMEPNTIDGQPAPSSTLPPPR